MKGGAPLPRDFFKFEDTVNDLGIHDIRLTFGGDKIPLDNYTVSINGLIDADYTDGQVRVIGSLKIIFKVRRSDEYVVTDYPPLFLVLNSDE